MFPPGVKPGRRQVLVPTVRAAGPILREAQTFLRDWSNDEARDVFTHSDPYITDDAAALLSGPAIPQDPLPAWEPTTERYPSRMFPTERYYGIAADPLPSRIKRMDYFVLNLFCGRRRAGDIQEQLELVHHHDDYNIVVLSIDIAIHATLCDMMNSSTLALWIQHVKARRVVVSGGGPPCETWSAVRWAPGTGPPPLRTHDHYWGKPDLTKRQMDQVFVGNSLLSAVVALFAAHMAAGTSCWQEHPVPADWELRAVSSFNWAPLRAIAESPAATTTDFDQCEHGQSARAPTRILALRMPGLHQGLLDTPGKGRCSHGRGAHQVLRGFDEQAQEWRTAKKKTYTPPLCAVIARSTAAAVHAMWLSSHDLLPEEMNDIADQTEALRAFYVRWDPYLGHDESWAPDYVPQHQQKRKFDREASRFYPPVPVPNQPVQFAHDPTATPRPAGPAEAHEEQ